MWASTRLTVLPNKEINKTRYKYFNHIALSTHSVLVYKLWSTRSKNWVYWKTEYTVYLFGAGCIRKVEKFYAVDKSYPMDKYSIRLWPDSAIRLLLAYFQDYYHTYIAYLAARRCSYFLRAYTAISLILHLTYEPLVLD